MIPNNHDFLRLSNLSMVSRLVWQNPGISRAEIANRLGLYKSSITRIIGYLVERNLIKEVGKGEAAKTGGRRPKQLVVNESFGCILGLEIQPVEYKAIISFVDGSEIARFEGEVPDRWNLENSAKMIVDDIMLKLAHIDIPVLGISFCVPGFIHPREGKIIYSLPFKIQDYPFVKKMKEHFSVPIIIENDANSCAFSHLKTGAPHENFIYFLGKFHQHPEGFAMPYSVGVGLGIVMDSSIYYGHNYASGEFLSTFRMTEEHLNNHPDNVLGQPDMALTEAWHNPSIMEEIFKEIVMNFPSMLAVLNPEKVYIGGDFIKYKDVIENEINNAQAKWENLNFFMPKINYADLDGFGGARGAIDLLTSQIFKVPSAYGEDSGEKLDWYSIFDHHEALPSPSSWRKQ